MDQSSIPINARQWSASVLEVDTNCGTAELLQRLTHDDYVVSTEYVDAMQVLVNPLASTLPANAIQSATDAGTRERMAVAVAGFANSFFEIPPYRRKDQWQALHQECQAFPQLKQWLNNLEPALNIPRIPETGDESVDTFVNLCCQSFVARGPERARRRQAIIHLYCQDASTWQPVVEHLQTYHGEFVTALVPWLPKLQGIFFSELAKNNPLAVPVVASGTQPAKAEGNWWIAFAALSIVGAIVRGIASNNGTSTSPNNDKPYNLRSVRPEIQWGLKVEDAKDKENVLRGARIVTEILRGTYKPDKSHIEATKEDGEGVGERPADALMPDQPASNL